MEKYRYSVITCNFGGYEIMREIDKPLEDVEYIYVTDDTTITSNTWKIIYDFSYNGYQNAFDKVVVFRSRVLEYCNSSFCVRVDGSIKISGNSFDGVFNEMLRKGSDISFIMSPRLNGYCEELFAWEHQRNIKKEYLMDFVKYCRLKGFRYETDINNICTLTILIQKNNEINRELNSKQIEVLDEIKKYNNRENFYRVDQIVFTYVLNTYFNNISVLPLHYDVISNDLTQICFHNTNNALYDYNVSNVNKLYLFNKLIEGLFNGNTYNIIFTKDDIIKMSKKIHLNINSNFYEDKKQYKEICDSYKEWIKRDDVLTLNINNGFYFTTDKYERYFTNDTYYDILLEKLCKTLNIQFNEKDFNIFNYNGYKFYLPKNIINNLCFVPNIIKENGSYTVYFDLDNSFKFENTFSLLNNDKTKTYVCYEKNPYSSQFKFSFNSFKMKNEDCRNNKTLLVITDGSIIPFIYILNQYYSNIIVIDNYFNNMDFSHLYVYNNITDILILTSTNKSYDLIINNLEF